ncbi:MAG: MgtE intracellular region [Synergistaceae bacterium]|jgi:flagellar motility protein MotE (MotC chaperone)|nr:MgtE intracellular region [Synergistaceae bacterium]
MAELQERNITEEGSAPLDPKSLPESGKTGKKKKKKKRGCGFFLILLLLAIGAAAGLQASGGVDLRPYVYQVIPRIPEVGPELARLLAIPDVYAMSSEERRRAELEDWESRIAESSRSLDQRERDISSASDDIAAKEIELENQRTELAARLEALSDDMGEREPGAGNARGNSSASDIEETIRTFQDMSPRNAAAILEKLNDNLAVTILDGLPQDARGNLLGRMDAEIAARLTEQLTELQRRRQRQRR